jgi:hypothetical protein
MLFASKMGIASYDMEGTSDFKAKFGGREVSIYHWYKSHNPLAGLGRSVYQWQFKTAQKI